ncbi:MAG: LEA type 2 family protein [Chloroflexi bacterium]|nr:LEA type 2 family protein [Chloroflexota bacterium]
MGLILKLLVAFLAAALILVFAAVAAVALGIVKTPKLVSMESAWGKATTEETQVITTVVVDNPNSFGLGLSNASIQAEVSLNDVALGQGTLQNVRVPKGVSTFRVVTTLDNARIPAWWTTHVANGERSELHIKARGVLRVFGRAIRIWSPTLTRAVETDLLTAASSKEPQSLSIGPRGVIIKSRQFQWGAVTPRLTDVEATFVLRNNNPYPIALRRVDIGGTMNSIAVLQGTEDGTHWLVPGEDTTVQVRAVFQNSRLQEWWPTHIQAGEVTQVAITAGAVAEFTPPEGGVQSTSLPLLAYQDQMRTNLLGK